MDAEEPELAPEPFQKQFESALCKIVPEDGYSHIYFVPEGNYCPLNDPENSGLKYWCYIKWYQPRTKGSRKFLSLQIRQTTFDELFPIYCPDYQGEKCYKKLRVEYKHSRKERMYTKEGETQNPVDAININLERADFFPEEIQAALRKIAGVDLTEQTQESP